MLTLIKEANAHNAVKTCRKQTNTRLILPALEPLILIMMKSLQSRVRIRQRCCFLGFSHNAHFNLHQDLQKKSKFFWYNLIFNNFIDESCNDNSFAITE